MLAGLFAMLLAEPRSVKSSEELAVMYLVDISDSIGNKMMRDSLEIIANTARKKPKQDSVGLVTFGKNAAVEFPARKSLPMDEAITLNSLIDRDATNVEQGLSLAAAMLPDDKLGRIVMFSDGIQTEGNLNRVLDDLKARGISVDVLPIQYDFNDEVWLERLELPQFVRQGETYEAGILLSSLTAGKGTLRLEENGKQIAEKEVDFQAGKNRFAFPIHLRSAGYYEYSATIEVPQGKDNLKQNNRVVNSVFLEGEGRILIVYDPKGEPRDRVELARALDDGKHIVEQQSAYEFARDPMGLLTYDCIIYCNVPADAFDPVQMQATRDAVFNYGLGFIMVGGNNSFGPGGYHRTVIEDALPVTMDISQKKVLPKGALVLVLHTCEFAEGNTWAKRITREAIKVLGGQDEVAAIDYEQGEKWIFKLTPASEYQKLSRLVEQAQPGDMPSFARTMEMSLAELQKSNAATKHVIIISDGDPQPPAPAVLQKFVDNQISVSTVAVFPHGGMEIGLLRQVAMTTGGRYYYPSDPNELPRIFIKEAKTLKRSMIQRKTVMPEVAMPHQILKGIESMPTVDGYVITTPKPSPAMTVLQVMGDEGSEGEGPEYDPLLSVWQYGLGKTAAFTSDLSNNWSSSWTSWDHFDPFIQQMVTEVSRVQKTGHLRMWTYVNGNEGVIGVEDFAENESFLEIGATIAGPQDRTQTVALKQVGPRRYQATIPLWGKGRYHIAASPAGVERKDDRAFGGFIIPYSPEYLRFRSNPLNLKEVAERTGGRILEKDMTVEGFKSNSARS
ncbi:MAG: VWA domain-containing protein [Planctomycetota bacterium]|nr:VWA domain-containing protein [Planctomycetota bacterium]